MNYYIFMLLSLNDLLHDALKRNYTRTAPARIRLWKKLQAHYAFFIPFMKADARTGAFPCCIAKKVSIYISTAAHIGKLMLLRFKYTHVHRRLEERTRARVSPLWFASKLREYSGIATSSRLYLVSGKYFVSLVDFDAPRMTTRPFPDEDFFQDALAHRVSRLALN